MKLTKDKNGLYKLTITLGEEKEAIRELVKLELDTKEVEDAFVSLIHNDHNVAEFGDVNGLFMFSKKELSNE